MKGINMIQLAKELGLSVSTVSKALGDSYEISASTKKRVLDLAKQYNYKPNPFASSLRKKKANRLLSSFQTSSIIFLHWLLMGLKVSP